jgi:hypothetical protein
MERIRDADAEQPAGCPSRISNVSLNLGLRQRCVALDV